MTKSGYDKEKRSIYNAWYREVVLGIKPKGTVGRPKKEVKPKPHKSLENEYRETQRQWERDKRLINNPLPLSGTRAVCSTFGCGHHLSLRETLFGDKCIHCQQEKFNPNDLL